MDDSSPDDWLPEGWRVEVHVRKNGRKDKWYFPPTGEAKFFSKLEVTRYLKRINSSNNGNNDTSPENKSWSSKNSTRSCNNDEVVDNTVNNTKISSKADTAEGIHSHHAVSNTSSKSVSVMDADNVTVTPTFKNNSITGSKIFGVADASNNLNAITSTSKNHNDVEESTQVANSEEKEENGTPIKSSKKVTFEKKKAEGLPPGWTKEVKLTKKGRKTRRDPYYTDPEGNYTFRSLRDALRYIQTGEPGKLAIKRREARNDEDSEDDQTPASAKKQKLGTDDVANGTAITPASKVLPDMPAAEHYDSSKVSEVVVAPVQAMQDGETDRSPSLEVIEVTQEAEEEHSTGKSKKKKKKKKRNVQLPLRSSKRLARVKLLSEMNATVSLDSATSVLDTQLPGKTVVKQSIETTVNASEESCEARKPAPRSNKSEQPVDNCAPNEIVPMEESSSKKPAAETPIDLPMGELWEDPCIAFAIKTLTGSLDEPDNNMPVGPNSNRFVDSANEKSKGTTIPPQEKKNLISTAATSNRKLEPVNTPPLNLSAEYTWADDPCIEFAIKTLTGAIPLDSDLFKQDPRPNYSPVFHQPTAVSPPVLAQPSIIDPKNKKYQSNTNSSSGSIPSVLPSATKDEKASYEKPEEGNVGWLLV